jgi:hypothetical protein
MIFRRDNARLQVRMTMRVEEICIAGRAAPTGIPAARPAGARTRFVANASSERCSLGPNAPRCSAIAARDHRPGRAAPTATLVAATT